MSHRSPEVSWMLAVVSTLCSSSSWLVCSSAPGHWTVV